jgi:hypothetical protein
MSDPFGEIAKAEATIAARAKARDGIQPEFRSALALETIADELLRLNTEVKTLRYLYATASVQPQNRRT